MKDNIVTIELNLDEIADDDLEYLEQQTQQKHASLEKLLVGIIQDHLTQIREPAHYS